MMHDFADSFVQCVLYLIFLAGMVYVVATCLFDTVHWLISWVVS